MSSSFIRVAFAAVLVLFLCSSSADANQTAMKQAFAKNQMDLTLAQRNLRKIEARKDKSRRDYFYTLLKVAKYLGYHYYDENKRPWFDGKKLSEAIKLKEKAIKVYVTSSTRPDVKLHYSWLESAASNVFHALRSIEPYIPRDKFFTYYQQIVIHLESVRYKKDRFSNDLKNLIIGENKYDFNKRTEAFYKKRGAKRSYADQIYMYEIWLYARKRAKGQKTRRVIPILQELRSVSKLAKNNAKYEKYSKELRSL